MNTVMEKFSAQLTVENLRQARTNAKRLGRHTTEVLEEDFSLTAHQAIEAMGHLFHYPVMDMQALNTCLPDFESLSFTEVSRRECIVLRDDKENHRAAFCDPFEANCRSGPNQFPVAHIPGISFIRQILRPILRAMKKTCGRWTASFPAVHQMAVKPDELMISR